MISFRSQKLGTLNRPKRYETALRVLTFCSSAGTSDELNFLVEELMTDLTVRGESTASAGSITHSYHRYYADHVYTYIYKAGRDTGVGSNSL